MSRSAALVVVTALILAAACGAAAELPFVQIPRLPVAPALDGTLADAAWAQAALVPAFVLLDGSGSPSQQTAVRLAHDGARLYLGFVCREDRLEGVRASGAARDGAVWGGDCLEVFINTPGAGNYVHLMVDSAGAVADEKCSGEAKDMHWNCDLQARAARRDGAWTATLSVPLAEVGLEPGKPGRINFCRNELPHRELSCWSATLAGFHQPTRAGEVMLGATPEALTGLDWGTPWPGDNTITCVATGATVPSLTVSAEGATQQAALRAGGDDRFSYQFSGVGPIRLELQVKTGETLLSRQALTLALRDYRPELAALRRRLAELSPAAAALPAAGRTREALASLEARAAKPQALKPAQWEALGEEVSALGRAVDGLRLRAAAIAVSGQQDYALGVQSPLVKMLRDDPFTGRVEAPLVLAAARHEYEATQLVLFAFDKPLEQVALQISDLKGLAGQRPFPARHFSWRPVGYIRTETPSYKVPFVGLWPDPLLPTGPITVKPASFEAAWISVYVPPGTQPGDYRGTVTVRPANAPARTVPLSLHVYDFTLPRTNHIKTSFGCGLGPRLDRDKWLGNMLAHRISPTSAAGAPVTPPCFDLSAYPRLAFAVRAHGAPAGAGLRLLLGSEKIAQGRYGPLALSNDWQEYVLDLPEGREAIRTIALQLTTPGEVTVEVKDLRAVGAAGALRLAPRPEQWYAGSGTEISAAGDAVRLAFRAEGTGTTWLEDWPTAYVSAWEAGNKPATLDFTAFDEYVARYGPRGLSAFAAGVPSTGYQQAAGAAQRRLREAGTAAIAAAWEQHLRAQGLLSQAYTYMADEPEPDYFPTLNTILAEVHRGAPGLANMMTARGAGAKGLQNVDIWCPEVYSFNPEGAAREQAAGREVWWYVAYSTRHPFPNYWVDYPALDCRVLWWMAYKHHLDGILYWSINYRWENAWETAGLYPGANGDGHLVYPAPDGSVVDSIRWEAVRDGAEDYEYLWLLAQCVKQAEARGLARDLLPRARRLLAIDDDVVRSFKDYNPDANRLLAARGEMAAMVEALCRALGRQPADQPLQTHRTPPPPRGPVAAAPLAVALPVAATAKTLAAEGGRPGACYRFEGTAPYITDDSGAGNHGIVDGGERVAGRFGQGLKLSGEHSSVTLPGAATLLGPSCSSGTLALWVRPDYDPLKEPGDTWSGWTVFLYAQRTSGNGLPDGYNEIGLSAHGQRLFGKVNTTGDYQTYPSVETPLRQGVWTHLAVTWSPTERCLYVDGKLASRAQGPFEPTLLDAFPVLVGKHGPTGRWAFRGTIDDVLVTPQALSVQQVAALASGETGAWLR